MHTFDTLDRLPRRCGMALAGSTLNAAALDLTGLEAILIVGVGEAALVGTLFQTVTLTSSTVPVVVSRESALPRFAGPKTLVIALSESGSDAVAVNAVSAATDAHARVAVVAPGGHLMDMAEAQGYPFRVVPHAFVAGAPLLGELFFGLWGLLASSSLLPPSAETSARAALELQARQRRVLGPEAAEDANPARLLTAVLHGRHPIIYGTSPLAEAAAVIWADRLQRTGHPARAGNIEFDADFDRWPATTSTPASIVEALILRDFDETRDAELKIDRLRREFGEAITCNELSMNGSTALERLWGAIYLAEWTSFYLAP